jgi:hypothetical protein
MSGVRATRSFMRSCASNPRNGCDVAATPRLALRVSAFTPDAEMRSVDALGVVTSVAETVNDAELVAALL